MAQNWKAGIERMIRYGYATDVDPEKRTARVEFRDMQQVVSYLLPVMQNHPTITIEKWVEEEGEENKWEYEAAYSCVNRSLNLGETYTKSQPDVIKNEKVIAYEKREGLPDPVKDLCLWMGVIERKKHRQVVTVYPWLPYVGQLVVCGFPANSESGGVVLGGL